MNRVTALASEGLFHGGVHSGGTLFHGLI